MERRKFELTHYPQLVWVARSRKCPDCQKLTIAYRYQACREAGVRLDQGDKRFHLCNMRGRVTHHEQTARAQHALYMRPPPNVLGTLGVEEHQVKGAGRGTAKS